MRFQLIRELAESQIVATFRGDRRIEREPDTK
jgi:hypothetical protein